MKFLSFYFLVARVAPFYNSFLISYIIFILAHSNDERAR